MTFKPSTLGANKSFVLTNLPRVLASTRLVWTLSRELQELLMLFARLSTEETGEHPRSAQVLKWITVSTASSINCELKGFVCLLLPNFSVTHINDWGSVIDNALNSCIKNKPSGQSLGIDSLLNVGCRKVRRGGRQTV